MEEKKTIMDEFTEDRNNAFFSMDETKIKEYCVKYDVPIPDDEITFWAGVHKVICNLFLLEDSPVSMEQYLESYHWLEDNGYSPDITRKEDPSV